MPTYRLSAPDNSVEQLQADSARREGIHTVLRGTTCIMGRPREVVVRRAPQNVRVELLDEISTSGGHFLGAE